LDLFDAKYYEGSAEVITSDLREHPVFTRFKDQLKNAVEEINQKQGYNISIPQFLMEYDSNLLIKLSEEKNKNEEVQNLLHKWQVNHDFQSLQEYLRNARDLFSESNKIDQKSISQYYIENKTYTVDRHLGNGRRRNRQKQS
jgi:hypothetical protein